MPPKVVILSDGQSYTTTTADTISAIIGAETVSVVGGADALIYPAAGSDLDDTGGSILTGDRYPGTNAASTVTASGAILFSGDGASALLGSPTQIITPTSVAVTVPGTTFFSYPPITGVSINGGADTIWANGADLFVTEDTADFATGAGFSFDNGSSNSTIVAGAGVTGTLFVGGGGTLDLGGASSNLTLVAGAGSDTVDAASVTGVPVLMAAAGAASLVGGLAGNYFVAGTGSSTIDAGPSPDLLDGTTLTFAGVPIVEPSQLHFG